jgi:hypothetical protein
MAVTSKWYAKGLQAVASGSIVWTTDSIKVSAHSSSYTPNQSTDQFFTDATNELSTANGYTAGGATLGTKTVTLTSLVTSLRAAATTWTPGAGQTLTIRYLVVRKDTGTGSTSPLLGYVDLGADTSATNAAWTATWDTTDGVLKLTAS